MNQIQFIAFLLLHIVFSQQILAQEINEPIENNASLEQKKEAVILEEKEALKDEVIEINRRFNKDEISSEEAKKLKEEASEIHALNIENRVAILENEAALSARAQKVNVANDTIIEPNKDISHIEISVFDEEDPLVDINLGKQKKYDKR